MSGRVCAASLTGACGNFFSNAATYIPPPSRGCLHHPSPLSRLTDKACTLHSQGACALQHAAPRAERPAGTQVCEARLQTPLNFKVTASFCGDDPACRHSVAQHGCGIDVRFVGVAKNLRRMAERMKLKTAHWPCYDASLDQVCVRVCARAIPNDESLLTRRISPPTKHTTQAVEALGGASTNVVVLSPDAADALIDMPPGTIFIIAGFVDRPTRPGVSLEACGSIEYTVSLLNALQ